MARPRKQQKAAENKEHLARRIWLAGLGAYGMGTDDAPGPLDKASEGASRVFEDLVEKGQRIEDENRAAIQQRIDAAKDRISEARERITEAAGSNTRSVEEMIGRVRDKLGLETVLHEKIDTLSQQISSLARMVRGKGGKAAAAEPAPKPRRGRPPGSKNAASAAAAKPGRKPGRKPGPKAAAKPAAKPAAKAAARPGRKPGRPAAAKKAPTGRGPGRPRKNA